MAMLTKQKLLGSKYIPIFLLAIALSLPILWISTILNYSESYLPYGDQWDTPLRHIIHWQDKTFYFGELFSQHNESRKFITSTLSLLGFYTLGFWSIKLELIFGFVATLFKSVLTALLFFKVMGANGRKFSPYLFVSVLLILSLLNFGLSTYIFQVWSVTIERTIVDICLLALIFVSIEKQRRSYHLFLLTLSSAIATYTYSSGLSLIPLAIIVGFINYKKGIATLRDFVCLVILDFALCLSYFLNYESSPEHTSLFAIIHEPLLRIAHYFIIFFGNFNPFSIYVNPDDSIVRGSIVLILFFVCFYHSISRLLNTRNIRGNRVLTELPDLEMVGGLIFLYSFIVAGMSCIARLPMGIENASRSDYTIHANFALLGLLAFGIQYILTKEENTIKLKQLYFSVCISLCLLNAWSASLLNHAIQAKKIEILEKISMFDNCMEYRDDIKQSDCYRENSPFHPLFAEYFSLANRLNIFKIEDAKITNN